MLQFKVHQCRDFKPKCLKMTLKYITKIQLVNRNTISKDP